MQAHVHLSRSSHICGIARSTNRSAVSFSDLHAAFMIRNCKSCSGKSRTMLEVVSTKGLNGLIFKNEKREAANVHWHTQERMHDACAFHLTPASNRPRPTIAHVS